MHLTFSRQRPQRVACLNPAAKHIFYMQKRFADAAFTARTTLIVAAPRALEHPLTKSRGWRDSAE